MRLAKNRAFLRTYLLVNLTASFGTLAMMFMVGGRARDHETKRNRTSYYNSRRQLSVSGMENVTVLCKTDCEGWRLSQKDTCHPKRSVVFLKTHKTGSSSIATMLERFGHEKGLNFALPKRTHVFSQFRKFKATDVFEYGRAAGNGSTAQLSAVGAFQILCNHARYDRQEMQKAVPNAVYVTILREPAAQLESAFNFFRMARYFPNGQLEDVFEADAESFYKSSAKKPVGFLRNGQLYDLGLEQEAQNPDAVDAKIRSLSEELDLVLITEYFDESLILLRRFLCWEFGDILYMAQLVREASARRRLSPDLVRKIRRWNYGDAKLYAHFNRTFWKRVRDYGPEFGRHLELFRELKRNTSNMCLAHAKSKLDRYNISQLKIPRNSPEICKKLLRGDTTWVSSLRARIRRKIERLNITI